MTTANHQTQSGLPITGMMHEIQESLARINAVCSVLSIADSSVGLQKGGFVSTKLIKRPL